MKSGVIPRMCSAQKWYFCMLCWIAMKVCSLEMKCIHIIWKWYKCMLSRIEKFSKFFRIEMIYILCNCMFCTYILQISYILQVCYLHTLELIYLYIIFEFWISCVSIIYMITMFIYLLQKNYNICLQSSIACSLSWIQKYCQVSCNRIVISDHIIIYLASMLVCLPFILFEELLLLFF